MAGARSRFVYVGTYTAPHTAPGGSRPSRARGVGVFTMDGRTGALAEVQVLELENPSWLALDPRLGHLYAVSEVGSWRGLDGAGGVTACSIDAGTGRLAVLGDQPTLGATPAHAVVDPAGGHLLVANYDGAGFSVLPILAGGGLGAATDVAAVSGTGPDRERQKAPHPHCIAFDPAGAFVHGADLGTDRVWAWRLDPGAGRLLANPLPWAQAASGSGPRHLAFHPGGRLVYVLEELASAVTVYAYDGERGALRWLQTVSTLPAGFSGPSLAAEIVVHPEGGLVYASNRGHDSVAGFAVDPDGGRLDPVGWTPAGGEAPRGLGVDPEGDLLLAANQNSDTIVPFAVDRATGALRPTGHVTHTPTPVCVQFGRPVPTAEAGSA